MQPQPRHHRHSVAMRYAVALACILAATAVCWVAKPLLGDQIPYMFFVVAVLVSTWYGGVRPGLVALVLGWLLGDYLLLAPYGTPEHHGQVEVAILLTYAMTTLTCILLIEGLHRQRARAENAAEEAHDRAAQLEREVAERQRVEQALRLSEDRLRLAAEAAGIGMWHRDLIGDTLTWTERGKAIFGLPPETDLSFGLFLERVDPADRQRVSQAISHAMADPGTHAIDLEYQVLRPDGSQRWVMAMGRASCDAAGTPLSTYGVMIDITQRKLIESQLQAAKAAAESANAAKDQFLAVLSHELRTPLTPVLALAGLLQRDPRLPDDVRDDAQTIRRNVELETRLIGDLLDLTRISRGKLELEPRVLDLCKLLRQTVDICSADAAAKDLRVEVEVPPRAVWVLGDEARLQQVFWNLLKNAIKFTPAGGRIAARCASGEGGRGAVEITDTGIGIEPQDVSRIFGAFEQADRSITREFGGLGLGLAISKALVEMHSGAIAARSEGRGKGATLRVELPLADGSTLESPPAPAAPPAAAPPAGRARPLRILLVEDHADTARIMDRLLASDGHEVRIADSVAAAMELVGRESFDLLISDLGLPDGSGLDLMRQLRTGGIATRSIALSGFGRQEDIDRSLEAGFAQHVTKPVDFATLQTIIARAMAGRS